MISLSGAVGSGAVLGTFYLPDREASDKGYCNYSHLDYAVPPSDWVLPPPDSVWYSVVTSKYGPRLTKLRIGDIQSVNTGLAEWNPCEHTTLQGDALYVGDSGEYAPFWRKLASSPKTDFTSASDSMHLPVLQPSFLSVMKGRPCTAADPKVHDYKGILNTIKLTTLNDGQRYYWLDTTLCANIAPPGLRSTFAQSGTLHRHGKWYARHVSGALATSPTDSVHWYKTVYKRPDRTTFVRDQNVEYHTPDSYSHGASIAWTGYGYVVEANHRVTTCKITHVRSDSAGRFQVKYDHTTDLSWFGWIPWSSFKGSTVKTTSGLIAALLILEPCISVSVAPSLTAANEYCQQAKKRAALLYDFKSARHARTAAVLDVQELDSNWIENLAGLKGTLDVVKPLIDGFKAVKTGNLKLARKSLASGYLAYKYVVAPAIADVQNIKSDGVRILNLASIERFSRERRRGASTIVDIAVCETKATLNYFSTFHLRLKNDYFSQIWNALEKFGLEPTASQFWDLIPLSFVADWFLPIGNSLKGIDAYNNMVLHRDILCRIESFKVLWPVEEEVINDLFYNAICSNGKPIEYSWYNRRIYHDAGTIDLVAISDSSGLSSSQMTQGAALITVMHK